MKFRLGSYVRTRQGQICRISQIEPRDATCRIVAVTSPIGYIGHSNWYSLNSLTPITSLKKKPL